MTEGPLTFERSPYRTSKRTVFPPKVHGRYVFPEMLLQEYGSPEAVREVLDRAVEEKVRAAHARLKAEDRQFQGPDLVSSLDPNTTGIEEEPKAPRRRVRFCMLGLPKEVQKAILLAWLQFQATYRECRRRFLQGEDVIWPHGTWAMVRHFGGRAAPPG